MKRVTLKPTVMPKADTDPSLEMTNEERFGTDPNRLRIQKGIEIKTFWDSQVGKILEEKAQEQIDDGVANLLCLDPIEDPKEFRRIQLRIRVAQQALSWISEVIMDGKVARDELELDEVEKLDYQTH